MSHVVLTLVCDLIGIASFFCWLLIVLDAFQHEIWKGIVGLIFMPYLLYYALAEFQHPKKGWIILWAFAGSFIVGFIHYHFG